MKRINPQTSGEATEPKVPVDLRQALTAAPKSKAKWSDLTPIARRDFILWIDQAKQAETRSRRIERACSMLVAGKRRPCCFTIVSFDLYKAFKASPKAKAQWSKLSSTARRDLIDWIDSDKEPAAHRRRIGKACEMMAAGKQWP